MEVHLGDKDMREKWKYGIFLLFFYFFLLKDYVENVFGFIKYVDEIIALIAIPLFVLKISKNNYRLKILKGGYGVCIVIFLLTGFIGNILYQYQSILHVAIPDAFLCVKFWMTIYVGQFAFRGFSLDKYSKRIYFHIRLVIWIYTVLIIFDNFVTGIFTASIRYGMRSTQLFYTHPTVFSFCCVFLISILFSIRKSVAGSGKYFIWIALLMCTTLRSKAMGAALVFILIYYFVYMRKKKMQLRTLLLFIPVVFLIAWDQIVYYFFSSIQGDSARYQLLVKAVQIANDHTPFGAGFGTFGSYLSGVVYSPLYSMYEISNVNGLRVGDTSYISDSFWPMILGQAGWIGVVMMLIAIWRLYKSIQKLQPQNIEYYASGICIILYLLIASVAESAFVHPLAIPLALWLGFILSNGSFAHRN